MFSTIFEKVIVSILVISLTSAVVLAWKKLLSFQSSIIIPEGAVIAFDRECKNISGWDEYKSANGMVVIGAGEGIDSTGNKKFFGPGQSSDGEYYSKLTSDNLPPHSHAIPLSLDGLHYHSLAGTHGGGPTDDNHPESNQEPGFLRTNKEITTEENASSVDSIVNIPPYVVLYYCVKIS